MSDRFDAPHIRYPDGHILRRNGRDFELVCSDGVICPALVPFGMRFADHVCPLCYAELAGFAVLDSANPDRSADGPARLNQVFNAARDMTVAGVLAILLALLMLAASGYCNHASCVFSGHAP